MELNIFFKSIIKQDKSAVVICNLQHKIIYMNPAAISQYDKYGGAELVGKSLLSCHNKQSQELIKETVIKFSESKKNNMVYTFHNEKQNKDVYMVALRDDGDNLIGYYEKHEYRNSETAEFYSFV